MRRREANWARKPLGGSSARAGRSASGASRWLLASVAVFALLGQPLGAAQAQSLSSSETTVDAQLLPPPPSGSETRAARSAAAMPAAKAQNDVAPAPPQEARRWGAKEWLLEKRAILGDAPDMVRYVANECILAGVAGAAIAVALTVSGGAVGPVASAALGVSPEMSTMGITALGCVAGAAAGVASAASIYAYEEPEMVRDFAIEQAGNIRYAAGAAVDAMIGVARAPQDLVYAAAAGAWNVAATAASGAQWVTATAASGIGSAVVAVAGGAQVGAGAVVTAAVESVGSWWAGGPPHTAPEVTFDVASVPELTHIGSQARVY